MRPRSRGIALTLLVALIAISGIITSSIVWHLANEMRLVQLRADRLMAYNMAYAGAVEAMYWWADFNATPASRRYAEQDTALAGTLLGFKTGRPANFAYFTFNIGATTQWRNSSGGATGALVRLRLWRLRNIHTTAAPNSIIATHAKVSWTPAGAEGLSDIRLNNVSVIPGGGPFASGTELTLAGDEASRTLASGALWSGNTTYLQWSAAPADPVKVTVVWTFKNNDSPAITDSKTHEVVFWDGCKTAANCDGNGTPLGLSTLQTFTVTSTGRVNRSGWNQFPVYRTVRATASGTPAGRVVEVIDWRERDEALL